MKMEISNKDRRLLIFLFSVLIAVCFISFGIGPVLSDYNEYREMYKDELEVNRENSLKIRLLDSEKELFDSLESRLSEEKAFFYPAMTAFEMDSLVSEMAMEKNVTIRDFSIKRHTENILSSDGSQMESEIEYADINLFMVGTKTELMGFVDDIFRKCPSICISSYSFLDEKEEKWDFEITLRIYMQKAGD